MKVKMDWTWMYLNSNLEDDRRRLDKWASTTENLFCFNIINIEIYNNIEISFKDSFLYVYDRTDTYQRIFRKFKLSKELELDK
jgi:hypothetical protein